MQNTQQNSSVLLSEDVEKSSLSVINEQEVLGKTFRVYGDFENPLFLAKDVAEWIEHSNQRMMLQSVDDDEKQCVNNPYALKGQQEQWFLTENGLYEVLMLSRKPIAKEFKKEVKKILHELRTTGKVELQQSPVITKELEVREKECKIATANLLHELANEYEGKSKTYKQILDAYATKELSGEFLLPLPGTKKTYSAEEVGKQLGISANKVGKIANYYGLKVDEFGCWQKDKSKYDSSKEVDAFRYFENAIPEIEKHKDEVFKKEKKIDNCYQADLI